MNQPPVIRTERLVLRPFRLADAADVQRMAGDYDVASMTKTIQYPYDDGVAETWIAGLPARCEANNCITFAIALYPEDRLIGAMALHDLSFEHERAEIGYWVGKPYWGNGYCTEAARAVVQYAFGPLGLSRVYATHFARNPASGRVMQKLGMIHEGMQRRHVKRLGRYEDLVLHGLLKDAAA